MKLEDREVSELHELLLAQCGPQPSVVRGVANLLYRAHARCLIWLIRWTKGD